MTDSNGSSEEPTPRCGMIRAYGIAVLLVAAIPMTGQAQSDSWVNPAGGNWQDGTNWSTGSAPSTDHPMVVISNKTSKSVTISASTFTKAPNSMVVSSLMLSGPAGTTNELLLATGDSTKVLEVLNGVTLNPSGRLAVDNSVLSIDASDGGDFFISGTVDVRNGGQIIAACQQLTVSNGTLVANALSVGLDPDTQGTLTLAAGTITLSSLLDIGVGDGAMGALWLTGGKLSVTNGPVLVGDSGAGFMTVSNGTFLARALSVAPNPGSQGTLLVAGGSLSVLSNMVAGDPSCSSVAAITQEGGTLYVTNAARTAVLEICNGTFTLKAGQLVVDRLVITNSCGHLVRTGGSLLYNQLVLDPNQSAVDDGIPNGWKQQYGLDPFDPNLAGKDADGDGVSNLKEFLAGTDPTNSTSTLRITAIVSVGADIRVDFSSVDGKYYYLERCDSLGGPWSTIAQNIPGNGGIQSVIDSGGAARSGAFYRVGLAPSGLEPMVDSDGDGIPDWWMLEYFGHPTGLASDSSLATADVDGDGFTNLQEYLAGTDPTNSASAFRITSLLRIGDDILVTWMMGSGKTNALEAATGDPDNGYTNSFADIFTVTNTVGTVTNYLDAGAATNFLSRFYRVRLVL